jgi:hypothetical protein
MARMKKELTPEIIKKKEDIITSLYELNMLKYFKNKTAKKNFAKDILHPVLMQYKTLEEVPKPLLTILRKSALFSWDMFSLLMVNDKNNFFLENEVLMELYLELTPKSKHINLIYDNSIAIILEETLNFSYINKVTEFIRTSIIERSACMNTIDNRRYLDVEWLIRLFDLSLSSRVLNILWNDIFMPVFKNSINYKHYVIEEAIIELIESGKTGYAKIAILKNILKVETNTDPVFRRKLEKFITILEYKD